MTIEDYELILLVKKGISDTAIKKIGNSDEKAARFYEGQIWGLKFALDLLKKVDHDVTLKEVKEECVFHFEREGCSKKCPMNKPTIDCLAFTIPMRWDVDAIQKHMKGAQQ